MSHTYSEVQLIQRSTVEARDRLLPRLMGGGMEVFIENYPAV